MKTQHDNESDMESHMADLMRIAGGIEFLQESLRTEPDPNRRDHLFNVLAEAMCN